MVKLPGFLGVMSDFKFPTEYLFKSVGPRRAAEKARLGICKHYGCTNPVIYKRRQCKTCKERLKALRNPAKYAFRQLKISASKRAIPFTLTFEEFEEFDRRTGYVAGKGRDAESLTVDRIDPAKGYSFDNIRAMTHEANSKRLVDGVDDPAEPIAKALALVAGDDNFHKFKKLAAETLYLVELVQMDVEGGCERPEEDNPEYCPF